MKCPHCHQEMPERKVETVSLTVADMERIAIEQAERSEFHKGSASWTRGVIRFEVRYDLGNADCGFRVSNLKSGVVYDLERDNFSELFEELGK